MAPTQQTNHQSEVLALLTSQFSDSTLLRALIRIFCGPPDTHLNTLWTIQELEKVFIRLLSERFLDSTVQGELFDKLGEVVGRRRGFSEDDEYLAELYLQIGINTSTGTPEELITIAKNITGATSVFYIEDFPAACDLVIIEGTVGEDLRSRLQECAPAGVRIGLYDGLPEPFIYGSRTAPPPDRGAGYGSRDIDFSEGGQYQGRGMK